jgi:hypothetical protein
MYDGEYTSGTSFAAPMVAGVAALLQTSYPTQSAKAIANHLKSTATPLSDWAGHGHLSAVDALRTMMEPSLSVSSVEVDDSVDWGAGNDEDANWDAGETVRLVISLENNGGDAEEVSGTLSSADPDVSLTDISTAWGGISSDETKSAHETIDNAFVSAAAVAHDALFDLEVSAQYSTVTGVHQATAVLPLHIHIDNSFTPPTIIGTDTTWTADKTYVIEETTVVMPGATLTIEPGTVVRFADVSDRTSSLEIRGAIDARGTEDAAIRFTSADGMPSGSFAPAARIAEGLLENRFLLAIGDVNNNGRDEIVTGAYDSIRVLDWSNTVIEISHEVSVDYPFLVVIGDADNDGDNDIVTSGHDYTASLIRWNGVSFDSPVYCGTTQSYGVMVGDADNDGQNDIVTCVGNIDQVSILHWNGDGFDPELRLATGRSPVWLDLGDADNDGDNDIVTGNEGSGDISLIRWNGTSFDAEIRLTTTGTPQSIKIGDCDNDGDNDIVSANTGSISVFRWNGTRFDPECSIPTTSTALDIDIGDIDDNGRNEVVAPLRIAETLVFSRWNGMALDPWDEARLGHNPTLVEIGDVDNDGDNDTLVSQEQYISFLSWHSQLSGKLARYGGLKIISTATEARFENCQLEFAPLHDESSVARFSDCVFDRSGTEYSLASPLGTNPLVRCQVIGNGGGGGIQAGSKTLIDCLAENNSGVGLRGGALVGCEARSNGDDGMIGTSAEGCVASNNGGVGISSSGLVSDCTASNNAEWGGSTSGDVEGSFASFNGMGINGANVSNSIAKANTEKGIQATGLSINNVVENNGGVGISGNNFNDCVVVGNGSGLSLSGTALRTYVAQNGGNGVTGGSLNSSTVLNHPGKGAVNAAVQGSWIVRNGQAGLDSPGSVLSSSILYNGGVGVQGKSSAPYTLISNSRISGNSGSGARSLGPMTGSAVFDNGGASGYDYEETRLSTQVLEANLSGNYWGPETTAFMNANPWGTYANVPRIHDFVDNTNLALARYENHLQSDPGAGPDTTAPAFLLYATPNLYNAVNVGLATVTLVFSEAMDHSVAPSVTFDNTAPFTRNVVSPIGWVSSTTWQGIFAFGIDTGDGLNTIRVANAKAADGFVIPDDTAHGFVVDVWQGTGTSVRNGVAIPQSPDTMFLRWDPSFYTTILGYQVVRSLSPTGPWRLVGSLPTGELTMTDIGLEPDTTYYYQVYEYDENLNSRQLTRPFSNKTAQPYTPTPTNTPTVTSTYTPTTTFSRTATWTPTFTVLPSFTFTPTAILTPTPTPSPTATDSPMPTPSPTLNLDTFPDNRIDAKDLLLFYRDIKSGHAEHGVLFDFSLWWKTHTGQ